MTATPASSAAVGERFREGQPVLVPPPTDFDLVTLGEALVTMVSTDGLPLESSTVYRRSVAGAEFNVAVGVARLGHRVQFIGRVGDDALGRVVATGLRAAGVEVQLIRDTAASTGLLVRDVQPQRPTTVHYARHGSAGSRLGPGDLDGSGIDKTRFLHVSGITAVLSAGSTAAVRHAMDIAIGAGACVTFDPNLRRRLMGASGSRELLADLVGRCSILLSGADELVWLMGGGTLESAVNWALEQGPAVVVVKDGARGAFATDGTTKIQAPAIPVTAVDPVGAGDAFAAGLISALLDGQSLEKSLLGAVTVAAIVVATPGDIEGLPDPALRDSFAVAAGEVDR